MDTTTFWSLIDTSRDEGQDDIERQIAVLTGVLEELRPEEIIEFDRIFREHLAMAYRWDLWAAASIINGGCSDL